MALDHEDLQPFSVRVLHPARTCLEELGAVHAVALELQAGERGPLTSRDGKHPYDIFQVLGHRSSIDMLSDPDQRIAMIGAIDDANRQWFGGPIRRPDSGYAISPAFTDAELSMKFAEATGRAMSSYLWQDASEPSWEEITDRILACKYLL